MTAETALFDLEPDTQRVTADTCVAELDLQADDSAWTSCRHCHTLTTATGISGPGHDDPSSGTCARMLAWQEAS